MCGGGGKWHPKKCNNIKVTEESGRGLKKEREGVRRKAIVYGFCRGGEGCFE